MLALRNFWARMKSQATVVWRWPRLWSVLAIAGVLGGAVWLLQTSGREAGVAVTDDTLRGAALAAAVHALESQGVACDVEGGQIRVPSRTVARARQILTDEGLLGKQHALVDRFDVADDIWATQAQTEKRWQAAKMAALSELISNFPSVQQAVVLFEPAGSGRFGSTLRKPTAAVNVTLVGSAEMTGHLVEAIADLVAGSIAGLDQADVCVIDSRGRSYRVGDASLAAQEAVLHRERLERICEAKVRRSLAYIPGVTVAARFSEESQPRCVALAVSVPRSYFESLCGARHGTADEVIATESARIRHAVSSLAEPAGQPNVTVSCHPDVPAARPGKPLWQAAAPWLAGVITAALIVAGAAFGLRRIPVRRRRVRSRRRSRAGSALSATADRCADGAPPRGQDARTDPLGFMTKVPDEDLWSLLQGEQARTIALVISRLSPNRAGTILARLNPARQQQVIRQFVGLGEMPPEVVAAVAESLSQRLEAARPPSGPVLTTVAEILNRAGMATEESVLRGLAESQPHLARSLRQRMLAFEDIARVPTDRLSRALDSLEPQALAVALRTAGEELRDKILGCLPFRRARSVRRQMEKIGPVRLSEVEAAQEHVAGAVRRFAAAGRAEALTG